ncbi:PDZ domain-containing protein [Haloferula sp. BvORR071]|uniref:PDZ domain-containing protein n=1 Tax=Haloferula sp. BvORR071 TaxID=1396141 RepID=UPI000551C780|nr:PDZ domain-containing protein [Haloferula sp. BvORR071]
MWFRAARVLALAAATLGEAAAGELETLVEGLANEDFKTREESTTELVRRGQAEPGIVRPLVLHHYFKNPDPEIRLRCETILRELATESYGFLGVQYRAREYFDEDGKTRQGIELLMVLEGKAANLAGLKVGDILMEVDGKTLDGEDPAAVFGRTVRLLGPGRKTTVKIDRTGEVLVLPVVTGAAPKEVVTMDPDAGFREWLEAQKAEQENQAR